MSKLTERQREVLEALSDQSCVLVVRDVMQTCSSQITTYTVTNFNLTSLKLRRQTFFALLNRKLISRESEGKYVRTLLGREALK